MRPIQNTTVTGACWLRNMNELLRKYKISTTKKLDRDIGFVSSITVCIIVNIRS